MTYAAVSKKTKSYRKRLYEILEVGSPDDKLSWGVDYFIISLILLNVVALIVESVQSIHLQYADFFTWFETISVTIFSVEYILRVWSCVESDRYKSPVRGRIKFVKTPIGILDLLTILPFYLPFVGVDLRFFRAIRLFRIFRLLKLVRYSHTLQVFARVFTSKKEDLFTTFFCMLLILLFASVLMFYAEHQVQPNHFSSIPAAMWWAVATLTTVGYGDIYPITGIGKFLASVIAILGIGVVALPTGILSSAFSFELQKMRATKSTQCPHCDGDLADHDAS